MKESGLPQTWSVLLSSSSASVDAALAEALPTLEDGAQSAAVRVLARRGRASALAAALEVLPHLAPGGRAAMLAELGAWRAVLGRRIAEGDGETAGAALNLIEEARAGTLADLAAGGLESTDATTRATAARTLRVLVEHALGEFPARRGAGEGVDERERRSVTEALERALRRWPLHREKSVILLALEHPDEVLPVLRELVRGRRAPLTLVLQAILERGVTARFARWWLLATGIETLAAHALRGLSSVQDEGVFRALLAETDVVADEGVRRGLRRLRRLPFLTQRVERWAQGSKAEVLAGVELARAMGLARTERLSIYAVVLDIGGDFVREALVEALLKENGPEAERLLRTLAIRDSGAAGRKALEAWRRRAGSTTRPAAPGDDEHSHSDPLRVVVRRCLHGEGASASPTRTDIDVLRGRWPETLRLLRAGLADGDPEIRRRAVVVCGSVGAEAALRDAIGRACHDVDAAVRAAAVALVGAVEAPAARRLLRAALSDPDARVRAGAVEACARIGSDELLALVRDRLSDADRRVRANAVGALLPRSAPRAAAELLDMLGDARPSWRRSALWVVGRLELRSQASRLARLAEDDEDPLVRRAAREILAGWRRESPGRGRIVAMPRKREAAGAASHGLQGTSR